jgi:ferredoxin
MHVTADHNECEGFALCMDAAPGVFDVDNDNQVVILQEHPPAEFATSVEAAVRACPKQALRLAAGS